MQLKLYVVLLILLTYLSKISIHFQLELSFLDDYYDSPELFNFSTEINIRKYWSLGVAIFKMITGNFLLVTIGFCF